MEIVRENFMTTFLGSAGTASTFVLESLNPWLSFACGVLTIVYLVQAILKNKNKKE